MNYKPFVSDFVDHSIDPVYNNIVVDDQGVETFVPSDTPQLRYQGVSSESFKISNRVNSGVGLQPAPRLASQFDRMSGIDSAVDMVDRITSPSNKRIVEPSNNE